MTNSIWKKSGSIEELNNRINVGLSKYMHIHFTQVGENFLNATMPVSENTVQPFNQLHGGASCVLAETLGSVAANLCLENNFYAVGQSIFTNHLRPVMKGSSVIGKATPIHLGKKSHIWEIHITEENTDKLVSVTRLTMAILEKN